MFWVPHPWTSINKIEPGEFKHPFITHFSFYSKEIHNSEAQSCFEIEGWGDD